MPASNDSRSLQLFVSYPRDGGPPPTAGEAAPIADWYEGEMVPQPQWEQACSGAAENAGVLMLHLAAGNIRLPFVLYPSGPNGAPAAPRSPARGTPGPYFRTFDLKLDHDGFGGYTVEPIGRPDLRYDPVPMLYPEERVAGLAAEVRAGTAHPETCETLGRILFDALFPLDIRHLWHQSQGYMEDGSTLCLRLDIRAQALASVPWEMLHTSHFGLGDYYLAENPQYHVSRCIYKIPAPRPRRIEPPLRVLVAIASPRDRSTLAAGREVHALRERLRELAGGRVQVDILEPATLEGLQDRLREGYHVLHFIGHGEFRDGQGSLVLEDAARNAAPVDSRTLAAFLRGGTLGLVVLNACNTAAAAERNPLLSVGQGALGAGVPAVVAMQGRIDDDAAAAFAAAFYRPLAEGCPLETCISEGRRAIVGAVGYRGGQWALPVLLSNAPDGALWDFNGAGAGAARAPRRWPWRPVRPGWSRSAPTFRDGAAADEAPAAPAEAPPPPRANLFPARGARVVAREAEVAALLAVLDPYDPEPLVSVVGPEGSGRSALGREVARRCLEASARDPGAPAAFQAVVWVSAQDAPLAAGSGGRWSLDDLYLAFAATLRRPGLLEARPEERLTVLGDLLAEGRFLLVIDDADLVQDRRLHGFLRALRPPSKALVLAREGLGVDGPVVRVGGLGEDDAVRLLREDGADVAAVAAAGDEPLREVARAAGGLPLVLRWAVSELRASEQSLDGVRDLLLAAPEGRLVDACLRASVEGLTAPEHDLLLGFALFPHPVEPAVAGAVAGVEGAGLDLALERLLRLRLIRNTGEGRCRVRSRARRYAAAEAGTRELWRERAVREMWDFAEAAVRRDPSGGHDRLEGGLGNVLWAADQAYELGLWNQVLDFRPLLEDFLFKRGYWEQSLRLGACAFDAADRLGNRAERAWCALYPLGRLHFYREDLPEAQRWCERALALFIQEGDEYGTALAERYLGRVHQKRGRPDDALRLFTSGLARARRFDSTRDHFILQGHLLASVGGVLEEQGDLPGARRNYRDALRLYRHAEHREGMATTTHRLGVLAARGGKLLAAERWLRVSRAAFRHVSWSDREAVVVLSQALLAEERGQLDRAYELLRQARAGMAHRPSPAEVARLEAALARVAAARGFRPGEGA